MSRYLFLRWKERKLKINRYYYILRKDGSEEIQQYVGGFLDCDNNPIVDINIIPKFIDHNRILKNIKTNSLYGTTRCVLEFDFWLENQIDEILNFISNIGAQNISCRFPEHEKQIEDSFKEYYINRH